jgi:hypothetical protein
MAKFYITYEGAADVNPYDPWHYVVGNAIGKHGLDKNLMASDKNYHINQVVTCKKIVFSLRSLHSVGGIFEQVQAAEALFHTREKSRKFELQFTKTTRKQLENQGLKVIAVEGFQFFKNNDLKTIGGIPGKTLALDINDLNKAIEDISSGQLFSFITPKGDAVIFN